MRNEINIPSATSAKIRPISSAPSRDIKDMEQCSRTGTAEKQKNGWRSMMRRHPLAGGRRAARLQRACSALALHAAATAILWHNHL
ncbi:MAG: hypothetical protein KA088_01275, partial [Brachymonas sp.]|nr:hypothetical protein [Brachymonas sp.]